MAEDISWPGSRLQRVRLAGYKSIREMDLALGRINVLIGANGAGKSNFASFFRMLNFAMSESLQVFIGQAGGASSLLYYGPQETPFMEVELEFQTREGINYYAARLAYAAPDELLFLDERVQFWRRNFPPPTGFTFLGSGQKESGLHAAAEAGDKTARVARGCISAWRFYQFHDTSRQAFIRQKGYIHDNQYLRDNAGNLAAYLYMLRQAHPVHYRRIVTTIRQIAPFFEDFAVEPLALNPNQVMLNWRERGRDLLFGPHQLSDGTLRMMALVTLLLQPEERLPSLIVIDEPELGLHPYALSVIADLVKAVATHTQVILSTQSVPLLDHFEPEDIIVVDREDGASVFRRLDKANLSEWLSDYALSELWEKNVIGGTPSR